MTIRTTVSSDSKISISRTGHRHAQQRPAAVSGDGVDRLCVRRNGPPLPGTDSRGPAPRGGAYTDDRIENLFGPNMHRAGRVLPELQHPTPGDTIGAGSNPMRIERAEPERVLATRSANGDVAG